jgi:hypothetical protein
VTQGERQSLPSVGWLGRAVIRAWWVVNLLVAHSAFGDDILTERHDNARTGAALKPGIHASAVAQWSKPDALSVAGHVYAQPLYVENLPWPDGRRHDVVFIATSENWVYAFDATRPFALLWNHRLGAPDRSTILNPKDGSRPGCNDLSPGGIGIEATPVIDRAAGRIYVSYRTNSDTLNPPVGTARQKLAALSLTTGVPAVADVDVLLPPQSDLLWERERNRVSLLLTNGVVYVAFGSRCEDPGMLIFHGWISAHDARSLAQVGTYQVTHDGVDGGGIWQASVGLAADETGNVYFATGNSRFGDPSFDDPTNLPDSIVRLTPAITHNASGGVAHVALNVADWFTPYRRRWLDDNDLDLGSSGAVLIPNSPFLMLGGKQGLVYVLHRDQLGHTDLANAWDQAQTTDAMAGSYIDFPDLYDQPPRIAQKFQAGINQYLPVDSPDFAPRGAHIASARQNDTQLDAFLIGTSGAVLVTWETNDGGWQQPVPVTPDGRAPPGACVAVAAETPTQLDVFYVANDGAVWVSWLQPDGTWTDGRDGRRDGARITPVNRATPGNCVALARQSANQLDAFYAGLDGAIWVTWNVNQTWTDGVGSHGDGGRVTPPRTVPPEAEVAAIKQTDSQLDAFAVDDNGAIIVTWLQPDGTWTDGVGVRPRPATITPNGLAPSGSTVRVAWQNANQLDAFVVDTDGMVRITFEQNNSTWTDGQNGRAQPVAITPPRIAPPGAHFDVLKGDQDNQLEVLWVGEGQAFWVTWLLPDGTWTDGRDTRPAPAVIANTPCTRLESGSGVSVAKQNATQVDVFAVDHFGAAQVAFKQNNAAWNPPVRLHAALPMCNWPLWPHIHSSPVFADFGINGQWMYVWPEKDHLKGFRWLGSRFDDAHRMLARDRSGQLVVAPAGPSPSGTGMPGGMLAVAIDPSSPRSGIVFASVPRPENQTLGILRAFDALTLREIWNNDGQPAGYQFAKFVPPTISRNAIFLPTADRGVLIYGAP